MIIEWESRRLAISFSFFIYFCCCCFVDEVFFVLLLEIYAHFENIDIVAAFSKLHHQTHLINHTIINTERFSSIQAVERERERERETHRHDLEQTADYCITPNTLTLHFIWLWLTSSNQHTNTNMEAIHRVQGMTKTSSWYTPHIHILLVSFLRGTAPLI